MGTLSLSNTSDLDQGTQTGLRRHRLGHGKKLRHMVHHRFSLLGLRFLNAAVSPLQMQSQVGVR